MSDTEQHDVAATKQDTFDVIIVGGGLVGASLACALAPLGLRIALLEAVPPRLSVQPSYDDRTLALSASSCRILEAIDVWPQLADNATAIREIFVTERGKPGRVVMRPQELGLEQFGNVVEARVFGAAIMECVKNLPRVEFLCPAEVGAIDCSSESARVSVRCEGKDRVLESALLVGADGAESMVRKTLGIAAERHDYEQTAIICNVTPELHHAGRAFECFTSTGPFALLPHVGGRCGLVWSVATSEAEEILQLSDEEFLSRAHAMFGSGLGSWIKLGKRSAYPLRLVRASEDTRPRALILGNAAHAIHPIGAQGFNLGLRDVAVLAELISQLLDEDPSADIGQRELLKSYSDWRVPDQAGTIAYSDGLARLYANSSPLASAARGLGLLAHALVPPLRRQLAIRAMGYRGRIPLLAQGVRLPAACDRESVA